MANVFQVCCRARSSYENINCKESFESIAFTTRNQSIHGQIIALLVRSLVKGSRVLKTKAIRYVRSTERNNRYFFYFFFFCKYCTAPQTDEIQLSFVIHESKTGLIKIK